MMSSANGSSWLSWIWALETLASNHADTSLLIDLVKKIPNESAFLRILDCLSVFRKGKCSDGSSRPECDGVGFTPLNGCADGLRQILLKSLTPDHELREPEMSKWDIETFVQNKRFCLPKCTLKQLKDVIVKDSHLLPSSLKERSGLLINNRSDGVTKRLREGSNSDAPENSKVRDLSYVKRVGDDSATANQGVPSACKQMIMYNATTKRKWDAFFTQHVVEGNKLASFHESRHVEDVPGGIVQDSGRDESNLDKEPWTKSFKGDISPDNVDYEFVALKKLKMSSIIEADLLHNQIQATRYVGKMTQGANKPKQYGELCAELRALGDSRQAVTQKTKSFDAAKDNCAQSCLPGDKATLENDHQREILSYVDMHHDVNDNIFVRENAYLNNQYSDSQDSLAKVNETKQQLCIICKIGGQLLVCSSGACRRVVHERCLAVAPTFDAKRRFYCPFCAYSRAVSEYSDSKKQLSLAKKALLSFISRDEYRLRNSDVLGREDQNHLREIEVSVKCIEHNNLENFASRLNPGRSMIHMKENSSVSCDLSSGEGERVVSSEENMDDKQNAERSGNSSIRERVQHVLEPDVQNCKAYISLHGGSKQLAVVEKLQEVLQQPNGVILVSNNEEPKIASRAVQDSKVHNSNCKDLEIARGSEPLTGARREQDVSNQSQVLPWDPAKPLRFEVEGTSGEKDDKSIACHSFRVRKHEQHYPYPSVPRLRRKKVPWSNAEEEALKEGVMRFASNHDRNMPWKKILEFGAEIFEKHRTAIDLKDKWRNICKGSPKV